MKKNIMCLNVFISFMVGYEPYRALELAIYDDNVDRCKQVLTAMQNPIDFVATRGGPLVYLAAFSNHEACLAMLLGYKAPVDYRNRHGDFPLIKAATFGYDRCAELLLKHGASVDMCDKLGNTALYCATEWEKLEVARVLLQYGASMLKANSDGTTPLKIVPTNFNMNEMQKLFMSYYKRLLIKNSRKLEIESNAPRLLKGWCVKKLLEDKKYDYRAVITTIAPLIGDKDIMRQLQELPHEECDFAAIEYLHTHSFGA